MGDCWIGLFVVLVTAIAGIFIGLTKFFDNLMNDIAEFLARIIYD